MLGCLKAEGLGVSVRCFEDHLKALPDSNAVAQREREWPSLQHRLVGLKEEGEGNGAIGVQLPIPLRPGVGRSPALLLDLGIGYVLREEP